LINGGVHKVVVVVRDIMQAQMFKFREAASSEL
jgi:hypothetical protein